MRSNGIVRFYFLVVGLFPQSVLSFLGVAVETVLQGFPCCRPISRGTEFFALGSSYSNVC